MKNLSSRIARAAAATAVATLVGTSFAGVASAADGDPSRTVQKVNEYEGQHRKVNEYEGQHRKVNEYEGQHRKVNEYEGQH